MTLDNSDKKLIQQTIVDMASVKAELNYVAEQLKDFKTSFSSFESKLEEIMKDREKIYHLEATIKSNKKAIGDLEKNQKKLIAIKNKILGIGLILGVLISLGLLRLNSLF